MSRLGDASRAFWGTLTREPQPSTPFGGPGTGYGSAPNTPAAVLSAMQQQGMGPNAPLGPGQPLSTLLSGEPWAWDRQPGYNIGARPRSQEAGRLSFQAIKRTIEMYDVAQICIRARIADIQALDWDVVPARGVMEDVSTQVVKGRALMAKPDGTTTLDSFQSRLLEDILRYDAGCLHKRRNRRGDVMALESVSGMTVAPVLDYYGRPPRPPAPSLAQYVNGVPGVWMTADDVFYAPFWPYNESAYGQPPIEAVVMAGNTDVRFQLHWLLYFTDGSLPDTWMEAPPDLSDPKNIQLLQDVWDVAMEGDQAQKHRVRWVPAGSKPTQVKTATFDTEFPYFLLRKTAAMYQVVPADLGFTDAVNKASSESQQDVQQRKGTKPLANHLAGMYTAYLQQDHQLPVEFQFDHGREQEDRLDQAQANDIYIRNGTVSPSEIRQSVFGLPEDASMPVPRFVAVGADLIPLSDVYAASKPVEADTAAPSDAIIEEIQAEPEPDPVPPDQPPPAGGTTPPDELSDPPPPASDGELTRAVGGDLRKWRDNAKQRIRRGKAPRRLVSHTIPPATEHQVWRRLQGATTFAEVDAAFKGVRALPLARAELKPTVAGLAVRAADTGRVLLLQRANLEGDPAAGTWEFPSGHAEDGEDLLEAARREWAEETGMALPEGEVVAQWTSANAIYRGFVYEVAQEFPLAVHPDHRVLNPDDPDGDQIEAVAWWNPIDLPGLPALRAELRAMDWGLLRQDLRRVALGGNAARRKRLAEAVEHHRHRIQAALYAGLDPKAVAWGWVAGVARAEGDENPAHAYARSLGRPSNLTTDELGNLYADGWLVGSEGAIDVLTKLGVPGEQLPLSAHPGRDWADWKPGDPETAARLRGTGLGDLLDQADVTIKGIDETTLSLVGDILAQGAEEGLSAADITTSLQDLFDSPSRAETIVRAEIGRADMAATRDSYDSAGVEQFEVVLGSDPCEICQGEADANPHDMSDEMPEYHPNCTCDAIPVVPDTTGALDALTEGEAEA